jgi:YVTN family beta-propeller protein
LARLNALETFTGVGRTAYVTNWLSNTVSVIDTVTDKVLATVPVGIHPSGVALNAAGTRAYVINGDRFESDVSVIDTVTNKVVVTIPFDVPPPGIAVNPLGTNVYVAAGGVGQNQKFQKHFRSKLGAPLVPQNAESFRRR